MPSRTENGTRLGLTAIRCSGPPSKRIASRFPTPRASRLREVGCHRGRLRLRDDRRATLNISSVPEPGSVVLLGLGLAGKLAAGHAVRSRKAGRLE